jgi:SAM-dependent methyltransferase
VHKPTVTDSDLARLEAERDEADRLYNDALTSLDAALTAAKGLPAAAAAPDTTQLDRLNRLWQVLPADPVPFAGWRRRLGTFVWRIVAPIVERQQEFNAALVEHANRTAQRADESARATGELARAVADEFCALAVLQSRLIAYVQRITLYVDTKDRFEAGRLWHELRTRTEGLSAGLSAIGDQVMKGREHSMAAERRLEARVSAGLTRLANATPPSASRPATVPEGHASLPPQAVDEMADIARGQLATGEDAATYAGFEDLYRGPVEEIGDRISEYLPLFLGPGTVVDLGCGRGEFLEALRRNGVVGRGVDLNGAMVERCRAQGLDVVQGDALEYLGAMPDASLGGILAAQVVEHLAPDRLVRLLDLARAKLVPGGRVVLETVNAACWAAFFSSYIRDITHVRPIHPDTLRYLLVARGFQNVDIRYTSPYPQAAKLHRLPLTVVSAGTALAEVVEEFNRNVEILNGQLFTHLDYAAIAENA